MKQHNAQLMDSLFPKVRQRVLGLLFGYPERDFYTNEIIRLIHMGHGVVQRELEKLSAAGILKFVVVGNQKHYQANDKAPLYDEVLGIVLKTIGLDIVLSQALKLCPKTINIAFIYGSIAKQTDTAASDIDILLIGNDLTYIDVFSILSEAEMQLKRKINPTIYSATEWQKKRQANNHFIKKVLEQPKIFLIGTEDELESF